MFIRFLTIFMLAFALCQGPVPTQLKDRNDRFVTKDVMASRLSVVGILADGQAGSGSYLGGNIFITCHHVVEGRLDKPVRIYDPTTKAGFYGKVIHFNEKNDIALIKVEGDVKLKPIRVA